MKFWVSVARSVLTSVWVTCLERKDEHCLILRHKSRAFSCSTAITHTNIKFHFKNFMFNFLLFLQLFLQVFVKVLVPLSGPQMIIKCYKNEGNTRSQQYKRNSVKFIIFQSYWGDTKVVTQEEMGKDECINPAVPNCQKQTLWGWHEGLTSFSGSCAEPCSLIDIYLWTLEPAGCPMVCRLSSQMKGGSHWGHATESLDLQHLPPWPVWHYAE